MIDIKLLRDDPDRVRASQLARGEEPGIVDAILAADERRRSSLGEFESLRAEQKAVSKDVGAAMAAFQKARRRALPTPTTSRTQLTRRAPGPRASATRSRRSSRWPTLRRPS